MKKIQLFILAIAVLLQYAVLPVSADEGNSWNISYYGAFADSSVRSDYFAEISGEHKFSGSKTLYVKCPASQKNESDYIEVKNLLGTAVSEGAYNFEFYVKKDVITQMPEIYIGEMQISDSDMTTEAIGSDGWKKYSITFDYSGEDTNNLIFRFYRRTQMFVLDDISLKADGSSQNIVADSGFEEYFVDSTEVEYDTADYQPVNIKISPANGMLVLSWVNPVSTELNGIYIYDVTGGTDELIHEMPSPVPGNSFYHKISNLSNGAEYLYKIVFTYEEKPDFIYFMGGTPSGTIETKIGEWSATRVNIGTAAYCPGDISIDKSVFYSGDASLRFSTNIDMTVEELKSNIYLKLQQDLAMEEGEKYKISFRYRRQNMNRNMNAHMSWVPFDGFTGISVANSAGSSDEWILQECEYTCETSKRLVFTLEGICESLWLDDIECYKLDENGEVVGENLVLNGDFENLADECDAVIENISATADIGEVFLEWEKHDGNYAGAKLYQEVFGEFEYRGILTSVATGLYINNLEHGEEYKFRLVPVTADGVEGEPAEVTFKTLMKDYVIEEAVLLKNGVETEGISGAGTYTVKVSGKNNAVDSGIRYEVLAALYNGNTLENIFSGEYTVPKRHKNAPYSDSLIEVQVPEDGDYHLEVYVIESRDTLEKYHAVDFN